MKFEVIQEDLETSKVEAIDVLAATRKTRVDEERFKWLYQDNPDGEAVLWAVRETESGVMAGFTVCLPRRILANGRELSAWNGADFSILPKYRTLGVALKLRRAAKEAIDQGVVPILYSHPNERMQVIHEKVGHHQVGRMIRYAKPLKVFSRSASGGGNRFAKLLDMTVGRVATTGVRELSNSYGFEIRFETCETFGEEFDDLNADVVTARAFVGVRDARYLNWRYSQYPARAFQMLTARDSGRLKGYCICSSRDGVVDIQDLFSVSSDVSLGLLKAVVRRARRQGARSVSMRLLEGATIIPCLESLGFRLRPDFSNMFAYTSSEELNGQLGDPINWFIHVGDRDV